MGPDKRHARYDSNVDAIAEADAKLPNYEAEVASASDVIPHTEMSQIGKMPQPSWFRVACAAQVMLTNDALPISPLYD